MSMLQQWQKGFPKGSLLIYLLVCPTSGQRMLSEWSWDLWVRYDRLVWVDWHNSHYSFCPLWHQACCAGTWTRGKGLAWGGALLILLWRWQRGWVETRTHQELMYNPVWLAKGNGADSWWHRSHSSWADVLQKADWVRVCNGRSFFRRCHPWIAWIKPNSWVLSSLRVSPWALLPWAPAKLASFILHAYQTPPPVQWSRFPISLYTTFSSLLTLTSSDKLFRDLPNSIKSLNPTEQHQVWPLCGPHHCCKCTFHLWECLINVCLSLWNIHSLWTKKASLFTHICPECWAHIHSYE